MLFYFLQNFHNKRNFILNMSLYKSQIIYDYSNIKELRIYIVYKSVIVFIFR